MINYLTTKQRFTVIAIFFMNVVSRLSLYLYLPAMPHMSNDLAASEVQIQATFLMYLLGLNIAQPYLIYVLNKGKDNKNIFLCLSALAVASSFLLLSETNIYAFIVLRFLQGLGCSFIPVIALGYLQQNFDKNAFSAMLSINYGMESIVAIIAPVLGAYIFHFFGWQAIFVCLFGLTTLIFMAILFVFEENMKVFSPLPHFKLMYIYIKRPVFVYCLLSIVISSAIVLVFELNSSFILQNYFKLSSIQYSHALMLFTGFLLVGSLINDKIVERKGILPMYRIGNYALFVGISCLLAFSMLSTSLLIGTMLPTFCFLTGIAIFYPNVTEIAIANSSQHASVLMFYSAVLRIFIQIPLVYLATALSLKSPQSLSIALFVLMLFMLIFFLLLNRKNPGKHLAHAEITA